MRPRHGARNRIRRKVRTIQAESLTVPEATFVSFVPKAHRAKLRAALQAEDTGEVTWRELKRFSGSEFYFSGPPRTVRKTHEFVTYWLSRR